MFPRLLRGSSSSYVSKPFSSPLQNPSLLPISSSARTKTTTMGARTLDQHSAMRTPPPPPRRRRGSIASPKLTRNSGPKFALVELEEHPFDICKTEIIGSLSKINQEMIEELEGPKNSLHQNMHLRSGMVLLKNFLDHHNQVKIIQKCRDLGIGSGGFYRPRFRDGAKLHLQMMCLGMNWDFESRLYEDERLIDGAKAPNIPQEFSNLVDKAIRASHDFLREKYKNINVEAEVPKMSPDICIVNFYTNYGRLGLHQDRDETKESLHKGLPVVSFSLGDSAEFLYGTNRDVASACKVLLESGDVLIFGGKSRLIFHGVSSILPNTAPQQLIDEARLRPGRLNLTFRQYSPSFVR